MKNSQKKVTCTCSYELFKRCLIKKIKKKILRALTETAILPRTGSGIQPYWSREPPEKKKNEKNWSINWFYLDL